MAKRPKSASTDDPRVIRTTPISASPPERSLNDSAFEPRGDSAPLAIPVVPEAPRPAAPAAQKPIKMASVLRTKVQPPPLRTSTLSRQRLLDRLATATQSRLTLLVADAGYGKTTLLADFSRRFDGACVWYSLESTDTDWTTIIHHLVAAAREVKPEFGQLTSSLLRTEPGVTAPKDAAISSFMHELQDLTDGRALLVFDDVHAVGTSAAAAEFVLRLLKDAPRGFSFVLAGRQPPSFNVARWAAMGELVEISTDELRFSVEETERLFADSYGQVLEPDVLEELDRKTRGWAACLQLFSTLITARSPGNIRAAAESLTGANQPLYGYLAQEVLSNLSEGLQSFLMRAALLRTVTPELLAALFPAETADTIEGWTTEADALGLLNRVSQTETSRQFHPLLRDILLSELRSRHQPADIARFHVAIARAAEADPLVACHHYIEAGEREDAMRCLGASSLQTMGSGRWGTAAQLAAQLGSGPTNGAVAAIQARRLLEEGNLAAARASLDSVDMSALDATVRAVVRQTRLTLGWRAADRSLLIESVAEVLADPQTPDLLRDIARVHQDSIHGSAGAVSLIEVGLRLRQMADAQSAAGYSFYAAVSLHNAAFAEFQAGRLTEALQLAHRAAEGFETTGSAEIRSTHAVLAAILFELSRPDEADEHINKALAGGGTNTDVPALLSYTLALAGSRGRAMKLLSTAEMLDFEGHTDVGGKATLELARAAMSLPSAPDEALAALDRSPEGFPLEFGISDRAAVLRGLALVTAGRRAQAMEFTKEALATARRRASRLSEVRLNLLRTLLTDDVDALKSAIDDVANVSGLGLAELADALGPSLSVMAPVPLPVLESVQRWPHRWLPVLRRQLASGNTPRAHAAASILDSYGAAEDIGRLRAFEKTYRRRGTPSGLGKNLARRVSPRLEIRDLGQVELVIGTRTVQLGSTRRKPSALLMYLVTRPNHTATREQIVDDLWPDGDITSGLNSLNQSLYFLRREIDPWYEDDISAEYITYQAELVAFDQSLVRIASVEFVQRSRELLARDYLAGEAAALVDSYGGPFSPEFEYEEWAIAWRTRVHGAYLHAARSAIVRLANRFDYRSATDLALRVLAVDPAALDVERDLVWLYWRLGAKSAAEAQYRHLRAQESADDVATDPLSELVAARQLT